MQYLKGNDSSRSYDYFEGFESESAYLKTKLLEKHEQLMAELKKTSQLEEQMQIIRGKYDTAINELETASRKLQRVEKDKGTVDRLRQLELNMLESEKKNDLLRVDLESMRGKVMMLVAKNGELEEKAAGGERMTQKINDRLMTVSKELRAKEIQAQQYKEELDRYRGKYEKQVAINEQIEMQIRGSGALKQTVEEMDSVLRQEKERANKMGNQLLLTQREAKEWRSRFEECTVEMNQSKQELQLLRGRQLVSERSLVEQLQKMTQEYNALNSLYRGKERELEDMKRKPREQNLKKKANFDNTRQFVSRLEKEEVMRANPRQNSKGKSYRQEKEQYLSLIGEVGQFENAMLSCNMERKRIVSEIDRIDETRVKTKDMISRRRRLEVELQNSQKKLEHIRNELKKMKVM